MGDQKLSCGSTCYRRHIKPLVLAAFAIVRTRSIELYSQGGLTSSNRPVVKSICRIYITTWCKICCWIKVGKWWWAPFGTTLKLGNAYASTRRRRIVNLRPKMHIFEQKIVHRRPFALLYLWLSSDFKFRSRRIDRVSPKISKSLHRYVKSNISVKHHAISLGTVSFILRHLFSQFQLWLGDRSRWT
jgi:hypothetical protein